MFEIILLNILRQRMEKIAKRKKLSTKYWSNRLVLGWFAFELVGIVAGYFLGAFYEFYFIGFVAAAIFAFVWFDRLRKTPDNVMTDWISEIGKDSLEPLPVVEK